MRRKLKTCVCTVKQAELLDSHYNSTGSNSAIVFSLLLFSYVTHRNCVSTWCIIFAAFRHTFAFLKHLLPLDMYVRHPVLMFFMKNGDKNSVLF